LIEPSAQGCDLLRIVPQRNATDTVGNETDTGRESAETYRSSVSCWMAGILNYRILDKS
jgi:hypothetical protein